MSIKPVDVGLVIQRMAEVDRLQQVQEQKAAVAQQQFGQEMRARLEQRETVVKAPPDTSRVAVNPDARRERKGERGKKEQEGPANRAEGKKESRARVTRSPGQRLDIQL